MGKQVLMERLCALVPAPRRAAQGAGGDPRSGVGSLTFPRLFLTTPTARWANVALTPAAVGWAMAAMGRWRAQKGQAVARLERFAFAYLFALAMSIVRLVACG